MTEGNCKIENKLAQIHEWAHFCLSELNHDRLVEAHQLGCAILEMLNKEEADNGIKFIALFEALSVGADTLQAHMHPDSTMVN